MVTRGNVLVDKNIHALMHNNRIIAQPEDVRASSLDLRIGDALWQINGVPSLATGFSTKSFIKEYVVNDFGANRFLGTPLTMTPGNVYLTELKGTFDLTSTVNGVVSPKSSAGRVDLHCMVITEGGREFNIVPPHYQGKLYMIMIPQSFSIRNFWDQDFVQLRLFDGPRRFLSGHELEMLHDKYGLVEGGPAVIEQDGIIMHLDLQSFDPRYLVAVRSGKPISVDQKGGLDPEYYFRFKKPDSQGNLFLEPADFLLAATGERARFPPCICGEMVPYREAQGEFKSHYAGFFDPGFGYGREGEAESASAVCEIRNISSAPMMFSHGQRVAMMRYEYLFDTPDHEYGKVTEVLKASNYQSQSGVKLAKYFQKWPTSSVPVQA